MQKRILWVAIFFAFSGLGLADEPSHLGITVSSHPIVATAKLNLTDGLGDWMASFERTVGCSEKIRNFLRATVAELHREMPYLGADLRHPLHPEQFRRWMKRFAEAKAEAAKREGKTSEDLPYFQCRETAELAHAYICIYYDPFRMNRALLRASLFAEGDFGVPKGSVVEQNDPRFTNGLLTVGGHDLVGKDLLAFEQQAKKECETDPKKCLSTPERELFAQIRAIVPSDNPSWVVIASPTASIAKYSLLATSHEIKHAQYFLQPNYQRTIDHYWKDIFTPQDRQDAKNALARDYDVKNPYLTKNEFQAYLLESSGEKDRMRGLIPAYKKRITDDLSQAGVAPIEVNEHPTSATIAACR